MLGVLLLVSSVGIAATLETRPDPNVEEDPAVAIDRSVAASQTALRSGAIAATETAARSPVTEVDADSTVGAALAERPSEPLDAYLELLVYLEVETRLSESGQHVGETQTTVSIPRVEPTTESVNAALDRIRIADPSESDISTGTLRVTVEDVAVTVERDDRTIAERTQDITVTVPSKLHELHDLTDEYESRLNTGVFDETTGYDGFGRRLAARLYPLAYLKIAQKYRSPGDFETVVPNDHTEVLANHAAFSVQESTFGTRDPLGERTMRGAWACMGADIGEELVGDRENRDGYDAEQFCEDLEYVYGDHEGELPDAPTLTELAEDEIVDSEFADATVSIPLDEFADIAYYDVVGQEFDWAKENPMTEDAFEDVESVDAEQTPESVDAAIDTASSEVPDIVDSVYSASVRAEDDVETSGALPTADRPERVVDATEGWAEVYDERETVVVDSELDVEGQTLWTESPAQNRPLHAYDVTLVNEYEERRTWLPVPDGERPEPTDERSNGAETTQDEADRREPITSTARSTRTFDVTVEVEGRHSYRSVLDAAGYPGTIDYAFRAGGGVSPGPAHERAENFERVPGAAIERVFDASVEPSAVPATLESRIRPGEVFEAEDLVSALGHESGDWLDVHLEPADRSELESWLDTEARDVRADVKGAVGPLEVERHELVTSDTSPIKEYVAELRAKQDDIVFDGEHERYANAPAKARAALRLVYVESVIEAVEAVGDGHEDVRDGIEDEIADGLGEDAAATNDVLDTSLGIGQDALNGDVEEHAGSIEGSPLTGDTRFDVRGAPTYLSIDPVDREDVAAVRPAGAPPLEPDDITHAPLSARYGNWIGYPGLPVVPFPGLWYASVSVWDVEVSGEYARFEVGAADGAPDTPSGTTYVREDRSVSVPVDGQQLPVGRVDPIGFESRTLIVGVVPGGKPGVGDTGQRFDCTGAWDSVGPGVELDGTHAECPDDREE